MLAFGIVVLWGDVGRGGSRVWNICEEGDESFLCSRTFWGTPCLVSALAWCYNGCCIARLLYSGDHALSERPRDPRELEMQERRNVALSGEAQRAERARRAEERILRMEDPREQLREGEEFRRVQHEHRIREMIRFHIQRNEELEEDKRLEEIMRRIRREEIARRMARREEEERSDEQRIRELEVRVQEYAQWMEEWRKHEDYIRGRDRFSSEPEFGNATEIP